MKSPEENESTPLAPPKTVEADHDLLQRFCASRDEDAFAELVRRHAPLVRSVTRRRLLDHILAEDATQQTFIALARRARRVQSLPSLAAWLHKAAVYEASNILRSETRHQQRIQNASLADTPAPAEARTSDTQWEIDEALASLPEVDRAILLLHHAEGLTYEDIAPRFHLTPGTAQRRGHRAMERLTASLRQRGLAVPAATALGVLVTPGNTEAATSGLATRALTASGPAASVGLMAAWMTPLAWITAAAVSTGLIYWAAQSLHPAPAVTTAAATSPPPKPPLPKVPHTPPPGPLIPPDNLSSLEPDIRQFVILARQDTAKALEFARAKKPGTIAFPQFIESASRALADRDLPAAERLFEALANEEVAGKVFNGIAEFRLKHDFDKAILWIDQMMLSGKSKTVPESIENLIPWNTYHHSLATAIATAKHPNLRALLLRLECTWMSEQDDSKMQTLVDSLTGDERLQVQTKQVSTMLLRGSPGAAELLAKVNPKWLDDPYGIALRSPEVVLDWAAGLKTIGDRRQTLIIIWGTWSMNDAEAAARWAARQGAATLDRLDRAGLFLGSKQIVNRILGKK